MRRLSIRLQSETADTNEPARDDEGSGRRRRQDAAAIAAAATATDAAEPLSRSVGRGLLLWTFYNAPVTPSSAAAKRDDNMDLRIQYI